MSFCIHPLLFLFLVLLAGYIDTGMGWGGMGWDGPNGDNAHNENYGVHCRARSWVDLEGVWESEIEHEF